MCIQKETIDNNKIIVELRVKQQREQDERMKYKDIDKRTKLKYAVMLG